MAFRAFISIDLEENERIKSFSEDLRSVGRGLKVVGPNNLHITLKFLGDADESAVPKLAAAIKNAVSGIPPFSIQLKGAGTFGNKSKVRTVWIGIFDPGYLSRMAAKLDEDFSELGFARETRPFSPHLTIARARENCDSRRVKEIVERYRDEDFGTQRAETLRLKKSELRPDGPIYSTVDEVRLLS